MSPKKTSCLVNVSWVCAITIFASQTLLANAETSPPARSHSSELPSRVEDVIAWLDAQVDVVSELNSYSCVTAICEPQHNKERQVYCLKVRHKPFSIFIAEMKPRQSEPWHYLFVEGERAGRMRVGQDGHYGRATIILPTSTVAMWGRRHPIVEYDLKSTLVRYRKLLDEELKAGDWVLNHKEVEQLGDKQCKLLKLERTRTVFGSTIHNISIAWDTEANLPIRFSLSDSSERNAGDSVLIEDYIFLHINSDCHFTKMDFDERNPDYFFHPLPQGRSRPNSVCEINISDLPDDALEK